MNDDDFHLNPGDDAVLAEFITTAITRAVVSFLVSRFVFVARVLIILVSFPFLCSISGLADDVAVFTAFSYTSLSFYK